MLTNRQKDLLLFIQKRLQDDGVAPSFEEMKDALSLRSKSGIHRLMSSLEERGFIRRLPHRARAVEIMRLPNGENSHDGNGIMDIPFVGKIVAGDPLEAWMDPSETYSVPAHLVSRRGSYALRVRGDSMVGAGILDGDIAIVEKCDDAPDGSIVVALVGGEEATLKYVRKAKTSVTLEPANDAYEPRVFGVDQVTIQGRLSCIIRHYDDKKHTKSL